MYSDYVCVCVIVFEYVCICDCKYMCPRHRITRPLSAATLLSFDYYNMMSKQCVGSQVLRKPYPESSPGPFRFRSSHPSFCCTGSWPVYAVISPQRPGAGWLFVYNIYSLRKFCTYIHWLPTIAKATIRYCIIWVLWFCGGGNEGKLWSLFACTES